VSGAANRRDLPEADFGCVGWNWALGRACSPSSDDNIRLARPKPFQEELCSLNQISQSTDFKALRKPPNALSRQGSVSLAPVERSEMVVRLISVAFGFG
jgi:hypothetical protein